MKRKDWNKVWKKFEKTLLENEGLFDAGWTGKNGQQAIFRQILANHGVIFPNSQWSSISRNFVKNYKRSPPIQQNNWDFCQLLLEDQVNLAIEKLK